MAACVIVRYVPLARGLSATDQEQASFDALRGVRSRSRLVVADHVVVTGEGSFSSPHCPSR